MTFDKPKVPRGNVLTYVRWVREGEHCRVAERRYEPLRRVRQTTELPLDAPRRTLLL
jgi:hypothetical protein